MNIENDMKKKRKYSGWQNHVSRTAVIASNALDHDPDANHIFIDEISWIKVILDKIAVGCHPPTIPHLGQGTEASNGMKDSIKVL